MILLFPNLLQILGIVLEQYTELNDAAVLVFGLG